MMGSGVDAVSLKLKCGCHFNFCIVFGKVVIESFECEDEYQWWIFEIKLSYSLLRFAGLACEEVLLSQVFWSKECIYDASAFFELWVDQTFFVYLSLRDLAFRKGYFFVERFGKRNCDLEAEIDAPTDLLAIEALKTTCQIKTKYFLSYSILLALRKGFHLLLSQPKLFTINQSIQKHAQQLLSILLVHIFIDTFAATNPTENSFRVQMFLVVFQELAKQKCDLSYFAELHLCINGESIVKGMQSLCGIKALYSRIEKASVSQIFQPEDLQVSFMFPHLLLLLLITTLYFTHCLLLLQLFYQFFLLHFLYFLYFLLRFWWHRSPLLQFFMQYLGEFEYSSMTIDYFIHFCITILHEFPLSKCICEALLTGETVNGRILHAIDKRMLGSITMLE